MLERVERIYLENHMGLLLFLERDFKIYASVSLIVIGL